MAREVTFVLRRHLPGSKPRSERYQVPVERGMTVLDCLQFIREEIDPTLAYRSSCRMAICGSCAMMIQGRPRLACQTQALELGDRVEVGPLPNYRVVKDLVVDLSGLFEKHRALMPYILRPEEPIGELLQSPEELERYLQFAYCTKCGACLSACPTAATDPSFLGPQALAQAYRWTVDTRDGGGMQRLQRAVAPEGLFRCHFAGACSEACPKGVDPALALQRLKRLALEVRWRLRQLHPPAPLAPELRAHET